MYFTSAYCLEYLYNRQYKCNLRAHVMDTLSDRIMMKKIPHLAFWIAAWLSQSALAAEQPNPQQLNAYYANHYDQDVQRVVDRATQYLTQRLANASLAEQSKMAVVFDIDDTLLWRYPYKKSVQFGYEPKRFEQHQIEATDPLVPHIQSLYQTALSHHLKIFMITAGCQSVISAEAHNLREDGITGWQAIYAKPDAVCHDPALTSEAFKTAKRKSLEQQGYDIVLSIGDQATDLGEYCDKGFKLPNPMYVVK